MSDEYDVVGLVIRKKEKVSDDGCVGCFVALIVIVVLGSIIGSCFGGKKKTANASATIYAESPAVMQTVTPPTHVAPNSVSRTIRQTSSPVAREQRIRCRNCSGKGVKDVWTRCPTCNGSRKVVDQAKTAQNAMAGVANGFARGRTSRQPLRPKTYYMSCPSCNGKGSIAYPEGCRQCNGNGYLIKR